MHPSRFNATVSEDGWVASLEWELPRAFVDLASRIDTGELDPLNPDSYAFAIAFRNVTSEISSSYENLDNVHPPGQQDPLPFRCAPRTVITHVLHEGDDRLYQDFASDPNFDVEARHQLYPFLRVEFRSLEVHHQE